MSIFEFLYQFRGSIATHSMIEKTMPSRPQSPDKFRRYRTRLKARGLRQIQLWVPDTTSPDFHSRIEQQVKLIESTRDDRESLDYIEEVADWSD